jgi:nicotinate-nucleotide pyrophosphorylase (carboxylating)
MKDIIKSALLEDIVDPKGMIPTGDHSALAIFGESKGMAKLLVKDEGILAGVELSKLIFEEVDKGRTYASFCAGYWTSCIYH